MKINTVIRKISVCSWLIIGPLISVAQNQGEDRIDSLVALLSSMPEDSQKVKMLEEISYRSYSIRPDQGIKFGKESLDLAQKINWEKGAATAYNTIGINYSFGMSDYPNALENYLKALEIYERLGFVSKAAAVLNNIGSIYDSQRDFEQALNYYNRALNISREMGNKDFIANNLSNISIVYVERKEYEKALEYKRQALSLKKELQDQWGIGINTIQLARIYGEQGMLDSAIVLLRKGRSIFQELGDVVGLAKSMAQLSSAHLILAKNEPLRKWQLIETALAYNDTALVLYHKLRHLEFIAEAYSNRSEIYVEKGDLKAALADFKQSVVYKDSVFNLEKDKKIVQQSMQYEFDKKETQLRLEQEKKDQREQFIRTAILFVLCFSVFFLAVVWRQRNKISKEKARSEELLLNILPMEVAEELKIKGEAEAQLIERVTVLFTDFKGFTALSEKLTPKELVRDLHECFSAFDRICEKHGIEKIKTIGDAYMAAGGLPTPSSTHARDVVCAGLEMAEFIKSTSLQREKGGTGFFEVRIGVHTGPVVAGIVGIKKFQYDIWGDTVNTASRMESLSEAGRVNVSSSTFEELEGQFVFEYRGEIEAKGKGKLGMYFVQEITNN